MRDQETERLWILVIQFLGQRQRMPVDRCSPSISFALALNTCTTMHVFVSFPPVSGRGTTSSAQILNTSMVCSFEPCSLYLSFTFNCPPPLLTFSWLTNIRFYSLWKASFHNCLSINRLAYLIPIQHQHYTKGAPFTFSTLPATHTLVYEAMEAPHPVTSNISMDK